MKRDDLMKRRRFQIGRTDLPSNQGDWTVTDRRMHRIWFLSKDFEIKKAICGRCGELYNNSKSYLYPICSCSLVSGLGLKDQARLINMVKNQIEGGHWF